MHRRRAPPVDPRAGILNIAEELDGLQIGLINIARNKPSRRVLPFFKYYREP